MKKILAGILIAALLLSANFAFAESYDPEVPLMIGAAKANITPSRPMILGGYGFCAGAYDSCRWSQGVHDPLYATAFALSKFDSTLLIISLDLVGFIGSDAEDVRREIMGKIGVPMDQIIVTSSHTHHSPDTMGLWGTLIPGRSGRDEMYVDFVKHEAVAAGLEAFKNRVPARLQYSVGSESDLHFNTYSEQISNAYIDDTLTTLEALDMDGKTIATITNWGCHPTTEDGENRLISSDWVGSFRKAMAEKKSGVHMFVNGSIGAAIQPSVPYRENHLGESWKHFVWANELGARLAEKTLEQMKKAKPVQFDKIEFYSAPLTVKMKNFTFWLAASSGQLALPLPPYGAPYTTRVTAAKLGPVRIGTVPGELSPQIGMDIRESLGGQAQIIVGLGQDALGYIIDQQQYDNKMYAYERFLCLNPKLGEKLEDIYRQAPFGE